MHELKPCPFCGTTATSLDEWNRVFSWYRVQCDNPKCGSRTRDYIINVHLKSSEAAMRRNAIRAWNRRA